jgi:hemoglobin-like flavoprotein
MSGDLGRAARVSTLPMDPEVLRRARSPVGRLIQQEETFAQQLHYDLAAQLPALPSLLAENGWPFCRRMVRAVLWVVTSSEPPHVVAASLRRIGAANRREGFPEAKYPSVARALVRAVRDLSGESWSTATGSAWISCFQWIEPHLIIGAQQAVLEQQSQAQARAGPQPPAQARAQAQAEGPAGEQGDQEDSLEAVAGLLDDEEDEDGSYRQIMVSMSSWRGHPPAGE